ncbi:MAG: hypothetical protein J5I41_11470 [Saprospiraceae bacterium]|nr:hypothetical protein [Saprospiraceae bacterium]
MFDRNQMPYGVALGILFPIVGVGLAFLFGWAWTQWGGEGRPPLLRERTLVLLAICLNLIPFRAFNRRRFLQSVRGVVTATLVLGILWVILYGKELLG